MIPLPFLAQKPGRRAWLRRRYNPSELLHARISISLLLVLEAERGLALAGPERRKEILHHIKACYTTSMVVPGLRATQRRRMFYFMCDLLNCPSDSCYALGRLYLEFLRQEALEGCDPAATTSELLRRVSRPLER